jgi:hypothetical protein
MTSQRTSIRWEELGGSYSILIFPVNINEQPAEVSAAGLTFMVHVLWSVSIIEGV